MDDAWFESAKKLARVEELLKPYRGGVAKDSALVAALENVIGTLASPSERFTITSLPSATGAEGNAEGSLQSPLTPTKTF